MDNIEALDIISNLENTINEHFKIEKEVLQLVLSSWLSGGHILLNDDVGTGKTTLSKILSSCVAAKFKRIQFTSDLMPADLSGINIFDPNLKKWVFHPGPLFSNLVLADEINRAPPKSQTAMLEAMAERQVTIDGETRMLDESFMIIATQNPGDHLGTFKLPEALNDRFTISLSLGNVSEKEELDIMLGRYEFKGINPVINLEKFHELQKYINNLPIHDDVASYALRIVRHTRTMSNLKSGVSIRAGQAFVRCAKALALINKRDKVLPDDVHNLIPFVLAHRLEIDGEAIYQGITTENIITSIKEEVPATASAIK